MSVYTAEVCVKRWHDLMQIELFSLTSELWFPEEIGASISLIKDQHFGKEENVLLKQPLIHPFQKKIHP